MKFGLTTNSNPIPFTQRKRLSIHFFILNKQRKENSIL